MNWDEMRTLRQPLGAVAVPGLEDMRVLSGKVDHDNSAHGDKNDVNALSGKRLFAPVYAGVRGWRWGDCGAATIADRERWPSWDGIHSGDPVTGGHVKALRDGEWLT